MSFVTSEPRPRRDPRVFVAVGRGPPPRAPGAPAPHHTAGKNKTTERDPV